VGGIRRPPVKKAINSMIKVGIIGCGINSGRHISAFTRLENAKITAVCDVSEEKMNVTVAGTGATGYTDYSEMLQKEKLDLAVVNLPHNLHNPCVLACANAGVNVFLEKPMGISVPDCEIMEKACKEAGVMLWVGHGQSFAPMNIRAKQLVDSGEYGSLVSIAETRNVFYFSDDRPRWFLEEKKSGGGIMMNLGAHALDKIKFFSGGNIEFAVGGRNIPAGYDVENSVQAFVRTDNGVTGVLNLIGHTNARQYSVTLYLTEGEIRILAGSIEACKKDGVFNKIPYDATLSEMDRSIELAVDALINDRKPEIDAAYGKDVIRAIKSIYGTER